MSSWLLKICLYFLLKIERASLQNGHMLPKWSTSDPKNLSIVHHIELSPGSHHMVPKWSPVVYTRVPKQNQAIAELSSDYQVIPIWSQRGRQTATKWCQSDCQGQGVIELLTKDRLIMITDVPRCWGQNYRQWGYGDTIINDHRFNDMIWWYDYMLRFNVYHIYNYMMIIVSGNL